MAGLNKAILIGRIGRDPQIREFESGVKQVTFSLATTESYRDSSGNWVEQTEWHYIVGYRYLAEKSFAKGDLVYVEGKIRTRKYTDQNGIEKYTTEIVADKINILIRKNAMTSGPYDAPPPPAPPATGQGTTTPAAANNTPATNTSSPAADDTASDLSASDGTDDLPF